eukprot:TRINITY_DN28168_c0_g1_i1.p1 TRINITY_DN28168_c0_g1~~TRINITY_DN28168_c0_g1_i1.p1  ORF type:complete len:169 (+),score=67.59 TRINITY_DN28168_c0_g1_i1:77-583(+)
MDPMEGWFRNVDRDGSGQLNWQELQGALQQAQLNFSAMSCQMLLRLFDPDRSGTINLQEFKNLFAWMHTKDQVFFQMDRDRSGTLQHAEIYQAVITCAPQLNLDQHAFNTAVMVYDPDRSGSLTRTEFVGLCAYLEILQRTFMSFRPGPNGQVSFNMNQFIFACSQAK